jgi:histidyl-tRNA synthetase
MSSRYQAPKGVSEYFPPDSIHFDRVISALTRPALAAGYQLMELPIFEETELFTRGVGESTDVVSKEMYTFEDRGGRSLTLRPEGTAGVMRSVIEHGLDKGQLPVKVFYRGPFFRAERPQAGRYRQFYQFGIEAIGVNDPYLDVEVIAIADQGFRALGLKNFELQITSLGDVQSRAAHKEKLVSYIFTLDLDPETRERAAKNPLRLFDDKRSEIHQKMAGAPLLLDFLSAQSQSNFDQVQTILRDMKIPFTINPRMVRGLDYYTGTTFEFVHKDLGAQSGIGGGGRYDGLMETLGGSDLSGIGFGLGIDRVILAMAAEKVLPTEIGYLDLYVIGLGDMGRRRGFELVTEVRNKGFVADFAFGDRALKGAMKGADRLGARFVLVIGDDEVGSDSGQLKKMSTGESTSVTLSSLVDSLAKLASQK